MQQFEWARFSRHCGVPIVAVAALVGFGVVAYSLRPAATFGQAPGLVSNDPFPIPPELQGVDLLRQSDEAAQAKSAGCVHCHEGAHDPHYKDTLRIGCTDCHGGDAHGTTEREAHVHPRFPEAWPSSANPVRSYALLNHECPEFIRFVNPGDYRVAHISCGTANCHQKEVLQNKKSMMATGCMLWQAALYNNGATPLKRARWGESYSMHGVPLRLQTVPPPTEEEMAAKSVVTYLDPLPRYEISQTGNVLRIFERGGRFLNEIGIPEIDEDNGKPRTRLSTRGLGTINRTDPTVLGLQKTRLFDPTTNFLGTNDHPGDYRSSGCTSCHVLYANDRSVVNSGWAAKYGNLGTSHSVDPTIPKNESGHPIEHRFTTAIPSSQCIVCHIHPGTNVLNSYLGFMWWDEETDGELIYPHHQKHPTAEQYVQAQLNNPNESSARNNLSDPEFVAHMAELNNQTKHTQFADFHGHGWAFRAVFGKDRKGNLLDYAGRAIPEVTNTQLREAMRPPSEEEKKHGKQRDCVPVHEMDIHLEKGMHCIDCHFIQDNHGDTKLYQEVRAAIEIQCIDCHGTTAREATLRSSGPAAKGEGRQLETMVTPFGKRRFEKRDGKIVQNSMVEKDRSWEIVQTRDTIDPKSKHYNERSHLAKTVRFDKDGNLAFGDVPGGDECACAHGIKNMNCIACHSSWNPSCYGCHLPQKANLKTPQLHNEGDVTRNQVFYNFQTLRDDVFMLARDGDVTGNRIGPVRSSCAVHVGSYNANRESIYVQQQTISSEGLSGISFSTNVPHTVRGGLPKIEEGQDKGRSPFPDSYLPGHNETKMCTDCHVSAKGDNNAIMAQLLMHGTGYLNFIGKYCWTAAGEHGLFAVQVTEREEPQAVIGSTLHRLAFPDYFEEHQKRGKKLEHADEHPGKDIGDNLFHPLRKNEVLWVQNLGEYLFAACGEAGLRAFDIAFIDHKGFSERVTTAPVSPLGQKFYVPSTYATCVAAPTTLAPDPTRLHRPENREPSVAPIYGKVYVTDKYEGLFIVGVGTTINGNPLDNFLYRELTFNPDHILDGATFIGFVGPYAYICCKAGVVVVNLTDPAHPKVESVVGPEVVKHPKVVAGQFRYAFIGDDEGIKVVDITDPAHPVPVSKLDLPDVHAIYVARTYAYLACGCHGLVILDIENPEKPKIDQVFTDHGKINDLHDVKLGITYTSEFAYLADGKNGLHVVQLTSPETHGNVGFSPRPEPELIATFKPPKGGHIINIARGLDRDRAVDEAGNQIAVFGRIGARPLNADEQHQMYLRNGKVWKVSDDPRDPLYHRVVLQPAAAGSPAERPAPAPQKTSTAPVPEAVLRNESKKRDR